MITYSSETYTKPIWLGNTVEMEMFWPIKKDGEAVKIRLAYPVKDVISLCNSRLEKEFVKDRDYRFNVVHGKNWIKLFVDDKLSAVVTDLPEYKVAFDFEMCNTACNISDFELYEFEDTGLEILEKKEVLSATKAGKSVNESESYNIKADTDFPIIAVVVLGVFLIASVFGGVLIIKSRKRSK